MRRSELCLVAGINTATFNSHRRNGDLPFEIQQKETTDSEGRTWTFFDLYDAMLLIAAKNLAVGQGVSWSEAARILREKPTFTPCEVNGERANFRQPGFFCARLEFRCEDGSDSDFKRFEVVRGTLTGIAAHADRAAQNFNKLQRFAQDRVAVFSIAAVNLSQAWDIAVGRAEILEIDPVAPTLRPDGEEA